MTQTEIMLLLREARRTAMNLRELPEGWQDGLPLDHVLMKAMRRLNEIQVLFDQALCSGEHRDTASTILGAVYVETLQNNPDLLPRLFPFFAVLCGDRAPGLWIESNIDWSLLSGAAT